MRGMSTSLKEQTNCPGSRLPLANPTRPLLSVLSCHLLRMIYMTLRYERPARPHTQNDRGHICNVG